MSFAPIDSSVVVARALAQRGRGTYKLGGGAHFTEVDVYAPGGNRFPGQCDCTGLLAYSAEYIRGPWNTDAIVDDAWDAVNHRPGPQHRFRLVRVDEQVRPGDFIVTGRGHQLPDHAGIIVDVLPGFVRGGPHWWTYLRVAHCSGAGQHTPDPNNPGHVYGATRVNDAHRWATTGYIIRPLHVTGPSGPATFVTPPHVPTTTGGSMPATRSARYPVNPPIRITRGMTADHPNVELQAPAGQPVFAPEDGRVLVAADRNDVPGFEGAGPAFVYLAGDSGMYHLLAELGAVTKTAGKVDASSDGYVITLGSDYPVKSGDIVGIAGAGNVVRWEMRPAPMVLPPKRGPDQGVYISAEIPVNPEAWVSSMTSTVDPSTGDTVFTVHPSGKPKASSDAGGLLWLAVGYFVGDQLGWW